MSETKVNRIAFAAACVAINVGLAKVANLLSLPFYLDTPGTILGAVLLPPIWAIAVAAASSIVGSLVINAVWVYYIGTQVVVALVVLAAMRYRLFQYWWSAIIAGILVGLCAAIASAPVTVIVFGGVTVPGTTAINAVLLASGRSLWTSVLAGSIFIEMIDKPAAALLAWIVLKRLPRAILPAGFKR